MWPWQRRDMRQAVAIEAARCRAATVSAIYADGVRKGKSDAEIMAIVRFNFPDFYRDGGTE